MTLFPDRIVYKMKGEIISLANLIMILEAGEKHNEVKLQALRKDLPFVPEESQKGMENTDLRSLQGSEFGVNKPFRGQMTRMECQNLFASKT